MPAQHCTLQAIERDSGRCRPRAFRDLRPPSCGEEPLQSRLFRGQRAKPSQRHTCQWGWPSAVRRCHPGSAAMWVDCSSHASGDFIEARHPSVQALISHLKSTTGPCATSNGNASGALLQQGDKHLLHGLEYSKQLGSSSFQ
eukprot:s1688_g7.t3